MWTVGATATGGDVATGGERGAGVGMRATTGTVVGDAVGLAAACDGLVDGLVVGSDGSGDGSPGLALGDALGVALEGAEEADDAGDGLGRTATGPFVAEAPGAPLAPATPPWGFEPMPPIAIAAIASTRFRVPSASTSRAR
jgi:hypothetical protein